MDLYCKKCGEPWEFFHVTDELTEEQRADFRAGKGCESCKWGEDAPDKPPMRGRIAGMLEDILGDDIDGQAAETEDAEASYGEEFWEE